MSVRRKSSLSSASPTNTAVTFSTDDWTAAQLLGGKSAADLQEGITIDNFRQKISGKLKYVTGYTQFSGAVEEQSGHYLVTKVESSNNATLYVGRSNGTWVQLDADGIIIGRITDKTKPVRIKAVKDGQETIFNYDVSALELEPES